MMNRNTGVFSESVLKKVILAADVAFLASLLVLAFCWWEVKTTITLMGHVIPVRWRDPLFLPPVICLAVHGIAAVASESLERNSRLGLFRFKWIGRFVLLFFSIMAPLMIADALLKRTKMDIHVAPIILDNKPEKEFFGRTKEMLCDPDLLWTFIPNSTVYGRHVNSLGFREREVNPVKSPGVRRVICLGDSVTAQGQPGYSQYLNEMLTNAPPDKGQWEAFNMGVYGYSSMQGLRLFQLRVRDLKPDIVTISFGRNDHTALENADKERMAANLSPVAKRIYLVLTRRTLGRLILHMVDRGHMMTMARPKGQKNGERVIRVPPEDFRNIMRQFVREVRAIGATPILVTAPRKSEIPEDYVNNNQAHSTEEFAKMHDQYAEIVREVSRETGAPLVDMQRIICGPAWDPHFARDAIHFDGYDHEGSMTLYSEEQPGLRRFAKALYDKIAEISSVDRVRPSNVMTPGTGP